MDLLYKDAKWFLMQQDILDAIDKKNFDYVFDNKPPHVIDWKIFQFLNDEEYCGFEYILGKNILNWMSFIPYRCFYQRDITDITIPNSIRQIDVEAFAHCYLLQHVDFELPNSISKIGNSTFWMCKSLEKITMPDKLSVICEDAFRWCMKLKDVTLNDGLKKIYDGAFAGCSSLNKIVIPNSVTYISDDAFLDCGDDFTIYCHSGSYAEQYAKENDINYEII